jgi:lauroyl/myristoyl acyltransferase
VSRSGARGSLARLRLAPDGRPRPDAPFGRGPLASRVLRTVIVAASAAGARLPAGTAHGLARVGGTAEWVLRPRKRRRLAENLGHAVGLPSEAEEVKALVRREIVNEARRSADLLWALARPRELLATTVVHGREHLLDALARGKGVLLVSAHIGGWEVATALPRALVPVPTTAIVTDDWLAWAVEGVRARAGLGLLYDTDAIARAASRLRAGEAVLMLGDYGKDSMRAYPVRFLDGVAALPAGAVALARLCGSPIVPFTVLPVAPRRWRVDVESALDPPARGGGTQAEHALLQELADRWTAQLRAHPEHWAAVYPIAWHP